MSDGRHEQDVRQIIANANSAFTSLEKVLNNRNINIQLRGRFLKCYVWSTLLYGSEAWTLSSKMLNKLEATEMWFIWRIQWISYTEHVTNVEVLRRTNTKNKLISEMVNRHAQGRNGKLGNYRLWRKAIELGAARGETYLAVHAKDERKYTNRTDLSDKR